VPGAPVTWEGWEDSAVPPDRVGNYLRDLRKLFDKHEYDGALYGHFGQGCIHTRIDFDLQTAAGIEKYKAFMEDATSLVLSYGGSLSGEHGDGQSRAQFLAKMFGDELVTAFREFKAIWDPDAKMNPGKMVDPYRIDENLRLGADYRPPEPATHFAFPDDRHSFAFTTIRCVGIGECRRERGGTMCPSYRVTREEQHSTRGRARLLFEMLEGNPLTRSWRDPHVKEALDLCLSCKGCKSDCPVSVDMATYKAEFLSHYYEGRLRPLSAYAMGLIHVWARLASGAPRAVNALTHMPGLSALMKTLGGISTRRTIPRFADRTFVNWFRSRRASQTATIESGRHRDVLLWPDTFNNYFHPETAIAAVEVLESAGYRVVVPDGTMCCGRPLYDYGFLTYAKRLLRDVMRGLRPALDAGTPIVVLEPSCLAVFRDELVNLFPSNEDARRLSKQTFLLGELLHAHGNGYHPPHLERPVMLHEHCHQKALVQTDDERALLQAMRADVEALDSGCCGMAGSFGFEADKFDVSMAVGELVLLPAVRRATPDTLIVADGFSCREQIAHATGRRAVHLAEALQLALRESKAPPRELPVTTFVEDTLLPRPAERLPRQIAAAALIGAGIALGAIVWSRSR
jgi:Fe-S oxidoreductase